MPLRGLALRTPLPCRRNWLYWRHPRFGTHRADGIECHLESGWGYDRRPCLSDDYVDRTLPGVRLSDVALTWFWQAAWNP